MPWRLRLFKPPMIYGTLFSCQTSLILADLSATRGTFLFPFRCQILDALSSASYADALL